jgi:hypothetical protein
MHIIYIFSATYRKDVDANYIYAFGDPAQPDKKPWRIKLAH